MLTPRSTTVPLNWHKLTQPILICVDGSGDYSGSDPTGTYDAEKADSFVNQIHREAAVPAARKRYYRGPDWKGFGRWLVHPETVATEVKTLLQANPGPIFMTGHSRGGAIVIHASRLLQRHQINVEALFLFDAVDRSIVLEAKRIPGNVRFCYHALRHPETKSRRSFANCGLERERGQPFDGLQHFYTTHGGVGGTGFGPEAVGPYGFIKEGFPDGLTRVTLAQQEAGKREARNWMWGFLRLHGVVS